MPTYRVTSPDGRTVRLTGDSPPTEQELEDIFKTLPPPKAAAAPEPQPDMGRYGKGKWTGQSYLNAGTEYLPQLGGAIGGSLAAGPAGAIGGSALGGAAGEALKQMIQPGAPPSSAEAAKRIGVQGAVQGAAEGAGQAISAGMKVAAPWLMQSALKPTLATLKQYKTTAPKLVQTLFDEGVNVTQSGLTKLQDLLGKTNKQIADMVAQSNAVIPKETVAAEVLPTAAKIAKQTNPTKDLAAVGDTVQEFLNHPIYKGPLSAQEAQALKQGTYQQIGKKYGQMSSAEVETQKALARGLKNEVAAAVPGVATLNAKDAELMAATEAVGRRVAIAGNKDPVGFAWVAHNPATFLAALIDRQPVVKSMLAHGMYKSAAAASRVSADVIRFAVHALASTPDATDESAAESPHQ